MKLSAVVELERKIWATRLQIKALQETAADLQIDSLDGLISEMSARLENLDGWQGGEKISAGFGDVKRAITPRRKIKNQWGY